MFHCTLSLKLLPLNKERRDALLLFAKDNISESEALTATCTICTLDVKLLDHLLTNYYPCMNSTIGAAKEHLMGCLRKNCTDQMSREPGCAWTIRGDEGKPFPLPETPRMILAAPTPILPIFKNQKQVQDTSGIHQQGKYCAGNTKDYTQQQRENWQAEKLAKEVENKKQRLEKLY